MSSGDISRKRKKLNNMHGMCQNMIKYTFHKFDLNSITDKQLIKIYGDQLLQKRTNLQIRGVHVLTNKYINNYNVETLIIDSKCIDFSNTISIENSTIGIIQIHVSSNKSIPIIHISNCNIEFIIISKASNSISVSCCINSVTNGILRSFINNEELYEFEFQENKYKFQTIMECFDSTEQILNNSIIYNKFSIDDMVIYDLSCIESKNIIINSKMSFVLPSYNLHNLNVFNVNKLIKYDKLNIENIMINCNIILLLDMYELSNSNNINIKCNEFKCNSFDISFLLDSNKMFNINISNNQLNKLTINGKYDDIAKQSIQEFLIKDLLLETSVRYLDIRCNMLHPELIQNYSLTNFNINLYNKYNSLIINDSFVNNTLIIENKEIEHLIINKKEYFNIDIRTSIIDNISGNIKSFNMSINDSLVTNMNANIHIFNRLEIVNNNNRGNIVKIFNDDALLMIINNNCGIKYIKLVNMNIQTNDCLILPYNNGEILSSYINCAKIDGNISIINSVINKNINLFKDMLFSN